MKRSVQFPIKGTFYYAADMALDLSMLAEQEPLKFQLEDDNPYDKNAVQIWLPKTFQACFEDIDEATRNNEIISNGLLLGYVPRTLAPKIRFYMKHQGNLDLKAIHFAKLGKQIEIDCIITIDQAWLSYLSLLIHTKFITQLMRFKRFKQRFFA